MPYLNLFANRRKNPCVRPLAQLALPVNLFILAVMVVMNAGSTVSMAASSSASFVQAAASAAHGTPSTLSLAFPSNTRAGDLLLVAFDFNTSVTMSSLKDSQGNMFTQVGKQLTTPGGIHSQVYYAKNIKGGADTVTVTLSGTTVYLELYLTEYAGINTTNPIDAQAGASGSTAAVSSGNATTTVAGDIIYGYCLSEWTCTAGSGFTARSTLDSNVIEDKVAGSVGSYAATGTDTSTRQANSGWTMQMLALKPASASAPGVSLSSSSLSFGSESVGASSTAQTVTLSNTGSAALSITSIGITGVDSSDFTQTNNCGSSVAAGAKCTISVTFTPAASGSLTAALSLTDNATGSPQSVSLAGTGAASGGGGAPAVSLSSTSLSFGSEPVAMTSAAKAVTLSNTGSAALNITRVAVGGTNPSDFAEIADTCGSSVAAGGNCTIEVTFTPSAADSYTATLSITDNAGSSPQTVSLSGTGAHDVILSWAASGSSGVIGYNIFRGATSRKESTTPLNSSPITGTTYTDSNVTAGQTYYYMITAVSSSDVQSADSGEVSATVP